MTDAQNVTTIEAQASLPPGVHPQDLRQSGPETIVPLDQPGSKAPGTGKPAFSKDNGDATAVYQRSDHDWTGNLYVLDPNNGGTLQLVGRQKGRHGVTLWVPAQVWIAGALTATPAGVLIAPTEGEVLNNLSCIPLNPGDSVTIDTEASVWAGLAPGQIIGYVAVVATFNPPGGGLGAQ